MNPVETNQVETNQEIDQFRAKLSAADSNFPATYWLTVANVDGPGSATIVIPQRGNLWVYYAYGNRPAVRIQVWHQGGRTTPINPGANQIAVGANDALIYQLANPATDTIKLAYQMI